MSCVESYKVRTTAAGLALPGKMESNLEPVGEDEAATAPSSHAERDGGLGGSTQMLQVTATGLRLSSVHGVGISSIQLVLALMNKNFAV